MPYFYISECLMNFFQKDTVLKEKLQKENAFLSKEFSLKTTEINSLKSELFRVSDENRFEDIVKKLDQANQKVQANKENLDKKVNEFTELINDLNMQLDAKEQQLKVKDAIIASKDKNYYNLEMENRKYMERIQTSHIEKKKISDFTEILISKIKGIKLEYNELEEKLRNAENRNYTLSVRAAEGFENLTPRPDFGDIEKIFSFENIPNNTRAKAEWLIKSYHSQVLTRKKTLVRQNTRKSIK